MKKGIHPEVNEVMTMCACGSQFKTTSTMSELRSTICSQCHPFFTGNQKFVDQAGRIVKFEQRYNKAQTKAAPAAKKKAAKGS